MEIGLVGSKVQRPDWPSSGREATRALDTTCHPAGALADMVMGALMSGWSKQA